MEQNQAILAQLNTISNKNSREHAEHQVALDVILEKIGVGQISSLGGTDDELRSIATEFPLKTKEALIDFDENLRTDQIYRKKIVSRYNTEWNCILELIFDVRCKHFNVHFVCIDRRFLL